MPEQIKRGPLWIIGRFALVAAAFAVIAAVLLAPRHVEDRGPLAVAYIHQWQTAPVTLPSHHFDKRVYDHFKFILKETPAGRSILAIPIDPRQKSFYAAATGPIHYTPGTQAANAESPLLVK
jgi:predicted outer membrane lipoprotein